MRLVPPIAAFAMLAACGIALTSARTGLTTFPRQTFMTLEGQCDPDEASPIQPDPQAPYDTLHVGHFCDGQNIWALHAYVEASSARLPLADLGRLAYAQLYYETEPLDCADPVVAAVNFSTPRISRLDRTRLLVGRPTDLDGRLISFRERQMMEAAGDGGPARPSGDGVVHTTSWDGTLGIRRDLSDDWLTAVIVARPPMPGGPPNCLVRLSDFAYSLTFVRSAAE